jgi:phage terminase large subunit GpA-like protein
MQTKVERLLDSCNLRDLIFSQTNQKSRVSGDTTLNKDYPGGFLHAIGAQNPGKLRQMSYPIIWFDELDGMPLTLGKEGSPIDLAEKRTKAYSLTRKIFYLSTPTITQTSQIYYLYMRGDQRKWYMPCKFCGEMQEFVWHAVTEDGRIYGIVFDHEKGIPIMDSVRYKCKFCDDGFMVNSDKAKLLPAGEWRPTSKSQEPGLYSYHCESIISPVGMYSWGDMVIEWAKCWDLEKNRLKDKEKFRTFRNTDRGLPYEELGESIKSERAQLHRRGIYLKNQIPNNIIIQEAGSTVLFLTCAVDVQLKNLFVDIKAWCQNGVNYSIDFFSIDGDVNNIETWNNLDDILIKTWQAEDGKIYPIIQTVVDSGRYSDMVYQFCQGYSGGVFAVKGDPYIKGGLTYKEFEKKTVDKAGLPVAFHVNTLKLKDRIAMMLQKLQWNSGELQPDWYPNFPEDFHDDYFKMFEAEHKKDFYDSITNKWIETRWVQTPGSENHAFDTFVYNLANVEILADAVCRNYLGLKALDWSEFWSYCKQGYFYQEAKQ